MKKELKVKEEELVIVGNNSMLKVWGTSKKVFRNKKVLTSTFLLSALVFTKLVTGYVSGITNDMVEINNNMLKTKIIEWQKDCIEENRGISTKSIKEICMTDIMK